MRTDWREGQGTCFRAKMPDAEDVLLGEFGALAVVEGAEMAARDISGRGGEKTEGCSWEVIPLARRPLATVGSVSRPAEDPPKSHHLAQYHH